jgi:histidine triad (HIT) family protein
MRDVLTWDPLGAAPKRKAAAIDYRAPPRIGVNYPLMPCLFCEIVAGRIPAKVVYQDDHVMAFHDVSPQAPSHTLIIPKKHITSLLELEPADDALVGLLVRKARDLAETAGIAEKGFRLVFNCGEDAGYSVYHIHLHLVGGRKLGWPPG